MTDLHVSSDFLNEMFVVTDLHKVVRKNRLICTEQEYNACTIIATAFKKYQFRRFIKNKITPRIHCTVYKDNSGALEMANIHKYRPRTKHLNVKLHHFRQYVNDGSIKIIDIDTADQEADYLTKPVDHNTLTKLRKRVMGW